VDEASLNVVTHGGWQMEPRSLFRQRGCQSPARCARADELRLPLPYLERPTRASLQRGAEKLPFSLGRRTCRSGRKSRGTGAFALRGSRPHGRFAGLADTGIVRLEARGATGRRLCQIGIIDAEWSEAQLGQLRGC